MPRSRRRRRPRPLSPRPPSTRLPAKTAPTRDSDISADAAVTLTARLHRYQDQLMTTAPPMHTDTHTHTHSKPPAKMRSSVRHHVRCNGQRHTPCSVQRTQLSSTSSLPLPQHVNLPRQRQHDPLMFAPVAPVTRRLVPTWALAALAVPLLALASVAVARLRAALARRFDLRRCQQFVEAAAVHHLRSPRWGSSFAVTACLHVFFVSLLCLRLCRVCGRSWCFSRGVRGRANRAASRFCV
jgi:hypothetical protein